MTAPSASTTAQSSAQALAPTLAARLVFSAFSTMRRGLLRLELPDGSAREFGDTTAHLSEPAPGVRVPALIRVRRLAFFTKCALHGDIGFAESFMDGDWETPNLTSVIGQFILNYDSAPTLSGSRHARLFLTNTLQFFHRIGHLLRHNSLDRAHRNIAEHYDLSNDFFSLWLDETMMYSSARWERHDATLAEAQSAKNESLCRMLQLRPEDHVLEIGTGWGGWSLHATRMHGCRVTTVTLSRQQEAFARRRVVDAGLQDRIEIRLEDYRHVQGRFDKLVSIEMLEAVGHRYLPDFARACHRLLKPEGLLALQYISCADHRYDSLRRSVDFIQKHVFPGSLLLSANRLNQQLSANGGFVLSRHEDFGRDYARTLQIWRESFFAKLPQVRALGFDDRFIRKWHYYLCYCEAAFSLRHISVVQTLHTRPNNLSFR